MAALKPTQTMSSFLESYSPDRLDWESPEFCAGLKFVWARQLRLRPRTLTLLRKRTSTAGSDSTSLSDMSISLGESGPSACEAVYHPLSDISMSLSSANDSAQACSKYTDSSLSDMSISFSTDAFSNVSPDFEDFAANVPAQMHTIQERMTGTHSFDLSLSLLKSRNCFEELSFCDANLSLDIKITDPKDDAIYCKIVVWLKSLFADVAQCFMNSDDCFNCRNIVWPDASSEDVNDYLQVITKDIYELDFDVAIPVVKLPAIRRCFGWMPLCSSEMLPDVDYGAMNSEQVRFILNLRFEASF